MSRRGEVRVRDNIRAESGNVRAAALLKAGKAVEREEVREFIGREMFRLRNAHRNGEQSAECLKAASDALDSVLTFMRRRSSR